MHARRNAGWSQYLSIHAPQVCVYFISFVCVVLNSIHYRVDFVNFHFEYRSTLPFLVHIVGGRGGGKKGVHFIVMIQKEG